ncbi:hypothetical protein ACE1BS_01750 [Aeromonas jandaei]
MDHLVVDDGLAKPVGRLPDPGFVLTDHGSNARLQFFDVLKHNGGDPCGLLERGLWPRCGQAARYRPWTTASTLLLLTGDVVGGDGAMVARAISATSLPIPVAK